MRELNRHRIAICAKASQKFDENTEGCNPPIGIILSRQKDELLVEYATYGMNSQLFVQKYQLYLPDRDALKAEIERTLLEAGQ
jgi:hypothetical protein